MTGARPALPPGPYLVVGLARSGAAAARVLLGHGEVIGADSGAPEPPPGIEAHLETDGVALLDRARCVVKSPGVPGTAPAIAAARERGIPVIGELELAWRLLPNRFVAVTGTNGKTTTAELLGAIWRAAGAPVAVAGNVGTPLSSLAGSLDAGATIVCEASSFQLEDADAFRPEVGVLLNVTEDHLDRHGSLDDYRAAKLRMFRHQGPEDFAVVPPGLEVPGRATRVEFGPHSLAGATEIRLRGGHNRENAMAAAAAALAAGLPAAAVARGLAEFAGVPHRLEEVRERAGVLYVNDSKATNVAAAERALEAFEGGVHAILGGSLKGGGFAGLRAAVERRCTACYLVGEASERLAADLGGAAPLERCGGLEHAVAEAAAAARPGETVLLAPACASYDQYTDYEQRGAHFRALVEELP